MEKTLALFFAVWLITGPAFGAARSATSEPVAEESSDYEDSSEIPESSPLLVLGARFDINFSAGLPTQQGFSIPSMRLSANGELSKHVAYRLAFGETREFSSALLPQLLPVEALIDLNSGEGNQWLHGAKINWRIGMFTPNFSPWWTPDLTFLEVPDYSVAQQSVLLSRDVGTEIVYEIFPRWLTVSVGAFNGNGIFSLNSNNSRAFVGSVKTEFTLFPDVDVTLGVSGYNLGQSTLGAVNYRAVVMMDAFAQLHFERLGLTLSGDYLMGQTQDSVRIISPSGGVAFGTLELNDFLKIFGRGELLNSLPTGSAYALKHFQAGPIFQIDRAIQAYLFYDYFEPGDGSAINSGQLRLRLII